MESAKGVPYRKLTFYIATTIILLFVVLGIFSLDSEDSTHTLFLFLAGNVFIISVFVYFLVPNTYYIRLKGDLIEIR